MAKWQTRRLQVPVSERTCGFKSRLAHHHAVFCPTRQAVADPQTPTPTSGFSPITHASRRLYHRLVSLLVVRDLTKIYGRGAARVQALGGVSLAVEPGSMVAIMGPSGSGKSTLLAIAGTLEDPTSGSVRIADADVAALGADDRALLRREVIGFVFQDFNLLAGLTAIENVTLPLELDGVARGRAEREGARLLGELGLTEQAYRFPDELSGGERQRVAIARAVVGDRRLLLADEPSGALDTRNGESVMELIRATCQRGVAAVVVTHDAQLASRADRVIHLRDGLVVGEEAAVEPGGERSETVP